MKPTEAIGYMQTLNEDEAADRFSRALKAMNFCAIFVDDYTGDSEGIVSSADDIAREFAAARALGTLHRISIYHNVDRSASVCHLFLWEGKLGVPKAQSNLLNMTSALIDATAKADFADDTAPMSELLNRASKVAYEAGFRGKISGDQVNACVTLISMLGAVCRGGEDASKAMFVADMGLRFGAMPKDSVQHLDG